MTVAQPAMGAAPPRDLLAAEAAAGVRWRTIVIGFAVILGGTALLQRFAINVAGFPLQFPFLLTYAAVAWLLVRGVASLCPVRCFWYLILVLAVMVTQLVAKRPPQLTSLAYMLAIYAPFCVICPLTRAEYMRVVLVYQRLMVVLALAGIAQFLLQFVWRGPQLFTFEGLVPDTLLLPDFNTVIESFAGLNKSNGVVFLEPSVFSQFLAIAVIAEFCFWQNWRRLALFALALFLSFSGTGFVALFPVLIFLLVARGHLLTVVLGVAALAAFVLINPGNVLDVHLARIETATSGSTQTSAYLRFVGPFDLVGHFSFADARALLFGYGAGSIGALSAVIGSHDPTWAKLVIEYGLLGTAAFLVFFLVAALGRSHTVAIPAAAGIAFFALGGVLLNPYWAYLFAGLCVFPARALEAPEAAPPQPA